MKRTSFWLIAVLCIITLGLGLRIWHLEELFHFTYDEEVFAFIGKRMWINQHIPFIGGVTPLHVHVAPYFYWLSGVILGLGRLNPLVWGIAAGAISVVTMITLAKVGIDFYGKRTALIAVILYAFSFYQNIFDRHYWGLAFDGLISLAALWCLLQIIKGKEKFAYLLAGVLAFGIHTDLSMLTLVVLAVITGILIKPKINRTTLVKSLGIFFLSFLPLLIFDIRHNLANSRGILQYLAEVKQGSLKTVNQSTSEVFLFPIKTLSRLFYVFDDQNLAYQYTYCPKHQLSRTQAVPTAVSTALLSYIVWLTFDSYRKRFDRRYQGQFLIFILILTTYGGIFIYGLVVRGNLFDHYLATLFPPFLLVTAAGLNRIWQKFRTGALIMVLLFVALNLWSLFRVQHRFGYADKTAAVKWTVATTGNEPFSLDVIGDCFRYNGYRYLFYLYGKEPVKSYVDANFTHLYDIPPAYGHPQKLVVITNPDIVESDRYWQEYRRYKSKLLTSAQFGNIEVLIVDNSNLDFVGKF